MRKKKPELAIPVRTSACCCSFKRATPKPALAASPADPVHKNSSGVAIKGYDAVAYFTDSKPVKGSPTFTHQWNGVTWQFASAEHRDLFAQSPEKYTPQYGCLNYSQGVKKTWSQDTPKHLDQADKNWPALHK